MTNSVIRSILVSLVTAAVIGCTDNDEQELATASPTFTSSPTDIEETPIPTESPDFTLVFIRGDTDPSSPTAASLWVSDSAGGNAQQISPPGAISAYAGAGLSASGSILVRYIVGDSETDRSLYSVDLSTGEVTLLLSYRDTPTHFFADVSPDGRYIAHTQPLGLELYDATTDSTRTLFPSGSGAECASGAIAQCFRAVGPKWSPDGSLLLVAHVVYEGGWTEVVDPFPDPPTILNPGDRDSPRGGEWSRGSDAVCAQDVGLAELSGLYLIESPQWERQNLLPEYEDSVNSEGHTVTDCDWVNPQEVAFLAMGAGSGAETQVMVYDRSLGETRIVVSLPNTGSSCCTGGLAVPERQPFAVAQILRTIDRQSVWTQPAVINLQTGELSLVLEAGDIVVDAVPN